MPCIANNMPRDMEIAERTYSTISTGKPSMLALLPTGIEGTAAMVAHFVGGVDRRGTTCDVKRHCKTGIKVK